MSICESFWDDSKKQSRQRTYQTIGYVADLKSNGIADPVAHYSSFVDEMNRKRIEEQERKRARLIEDDPRRNIGYFLLKGIWRRLAPDHDLKMLQSMRSFEFDLAHLIEGLVYARVVDPCSKRRTLLEVLPCLYEQYDFSYDQLLNGVEFIGSEYEKIIEIFTHHTAGKFGLDRSVCYFDCTNFYFEIDREDLFRRKGPSKENRHDPIVGMGLLLDSHLVPIAMKMYPGNESEKPVLREIIRDMKKRHCLTGRTVQVADKGLNCSQNIIAAIEEGDGYIFSRSLKQVEEKERKWVLLDNDYDDVYSEGRLAYRIKDCVDEFQYMVQGITGRRTRVLLREKRVATFNPSLRRKKEAEIARLVEKAKRLTASKAKRDEYGDCSRYVNFKPAKKDGSAVVEGKVIASINNDAIERDMQLAGYNLLVTSELEMDKYDVYKTYHTLSEIEHSFRMMKSYLDARPVFVQKQNSITGHFTICYISLLLLRILNVFVFDMKYSMEVLTDFIRRLQIVRGERSGWVNITASSKIVSYIASSFDVPITSYYLKTQQVNRLFHITAKSGH